jgi:hypothetical protein
MMMKLLKRSLIPILAVICFDMIAIGAIMYQVYLTDGIIPTLNETILSRPICYFWILWSLLIFFCVNGIQKEYYALVIRALQDFPLLPENKIRSIARSELLYLYSKKLMVVFGGLPLVYFSSNDISWSLDSLRKVLILWMPFILDLLIYLCIIVHRKRHSVK